eukprot:2766540-Alexandrium_andersonii.AAC.1
MARDGSGGMGQGRGVGQDPSGGAAGLCEGGRRVGRASRAGRVADPRDRGRLEAPGRLAGGPFSRCGGSSASRPGLGRGHCGL